MPFVGSGVDLGLQVIAVVVLFATIGAAGFGFWKLHELPISQAHKNSHQQLSLITALTWIGFLWHWVWVLAVIVAFVDGDKMIARVRDIWKAEGDKSC